MQYLYKSNRVPDWLIKLPITYLIINRVNFWQKRFIGSELVTWRRQEAMAVGLPTWLPNKPVDVGHLNLGTFTKGSKTWTGWLFAMT